MFGFIKRLVGHQVPPPFNEDPFGRDKEPMPTARAPIATANRESQAAVLQRDEIIDAKTRIVGYRFAARMPADPLHNAPLATLELLSASHISAFAERRLALIPIRVHDWFNFDYRPLIGARTTFLLDLPDSPESIARWQEAAQAIRTEGARIALPWNDNVRHQSPPLDLVDVVLIDFSSYSLASFERIVSTLKRETPTLELIAENINSWPERRYCSSLKVDCCMGAFTTCIDEEQGSEDISQSRLVLIEMINLLRRDADQSEIAKVAKRDPGIAVKLVTMANSPMMGLPQPVNSIEQACLMLGREQLYRWLSIAMFRASGVSPRDEILLELALARGRFLELIGRFHHGKTECDELFLVGLLSLIDTLLGVPMAKVVERLHLSETINQVLLHSEGPLGKYLMLAIVVEKGRAEQVARLADQLNIPLTEIEQASSAALMWADNSVNQSQ